MKKPRLSLIGGVILLAVSAQSVAQNDGSAANPKQLKVPSDMDQPKAMPDSDTGLQVEELRYKDRLGSVSVEHGDTGVRDYYDLNRTDEIYQVGGMMEQSAMRTWRLGGGNKKK